MNDRKQHVIKMAHQLFIDKGFQNTSIQDILTYSGISKGTFYNYFSSKNELLIALFKSIYKNVEQARNELLIGQDPRDIGIFIKQVELQLKTNRTSKLISLFEEVLVSNDEDLKQFINRGQLRALRWIYGRFIDLFGEDKKPYLLDCSIMFMGILHHNLKFNKLAHGANTDIGQIAQYSVERMIGMVEEVSRSHDQLIQPELLERWLPNCQLPDRTFQEQLFRTILGMKKALNPHKAQQKYTELLDFLQEELLQSKSPRKYLVESALLSLKEDSALFSSEDLQMLSQLIHTFFNQDKVTQ
ncbi:TetR/AcrR family transcriptional regulator [Mesobacillus foraminis]|uniref:TetR/AcrR family transcriptional regulator n=1 Tax=Mesobacillus foraminis TaxID=279826 RepID=UPI0039A036B1